MNVFAVALSHPIAAGVNRLMAIFGICVFSEFILQPPHQIPGIQQAVTGPHRG